MKCDKCDNEATVHEVRIESGKRREKHLCEQCAKSEGVAPQLGAPLTQLLTQFITHQGTAAPAAAGGSTAAAAKPCPSCGLTYAQFRQSGLLGCPKCYEVFEGQLGPLLARAHEGGTHHQGKSPRRPIGSRVGATAGTGATGGLPARGETPSPPAPSSAPTVAPSPSTADRIALLKKQLTEAVKAEQYEQAAKIRDELARLEGHPPRAAAKRKPPAPPAKEGGA